MNEQENTTFDEWAKVELFGHNVIIARVTKADIGDFLRCDVPNADGTINHTRFINPKAIYAISPISKDLALRVAGNWSSQPIHEYDLPTPVKVQELEAPSDPKYIPRDRQPGDLF